MDAKNVSDVSEHGNKKSKLITYLERLRVLPARLAWRFSVRGIK